MVQVTPMIVAWGWLVCVRKGQLCTLTSRDIRLCHSKTLNSPKHRLSWSEYTITCIVSARGLDWGLDTHDMTIETPKTPRIFNIT